MSKAKYCYVLVNKETGSMLIEDAKLPIYWNKKVAQERCSGFSKYMVHRLKLEDVNQLILSTPINK